jgi:hypothetical protein
VLDAHRRRGTDWLASNYDEVSIGQSPKKAARGRSSAIRIDDFNSGGLRVIKRNATHNLLIGGMTRFSGSPAISSFMDLGTPRLSYSQFFSDLGGMLRSK